MMMVPKNSLKTEACLFLFSFLYQNHKFKHVLVCTSHYDVYTTFPSIRFAVSSSQSLISHRLQILNENILCLK